MAKAKQLAASILEVSEGDLEIGDGRVHVAGAKELGVELAELARILQGAPGYSFPAGLEPGLEAVSNYRIDALTYANACHIAEVEVDIRTGGIRLLRYVAVQDAGRLINPMIVDGQIKGGIVHGISNALFECMEYDDTGQPLTTNFGDYLLPIATDLPNIETSYTESPSPLNPLGAKGVGELGNRPRRRCGYFRDRKCTGRLRTSHFKGAHFPSIYFRSYCEIGGSPPSLICRLCNSLQLMAIRENYNGRRSNELENNDVIGGLDCHGDCLARWPAVVPAILPKTAPFISPVPPG